MLRSVVLLGLTAAAAGGIAGDIRSQMPHGADPAASASAGRLAALEHRLAIDVTQRPAWIAFQRAALAQNRVNPSLGLVASLQARSVAADRLRDAATTLSAALTPAQRAQADAEWRGGGAAGS